MDILQRFDNIVGRMEAAAARAGRRTGEVRLVAVSKKHPAGAVVSLAAHWEALGGRPAFGENYMQEAAAKIEDVSAAIPEIPVEWHFIGHLQSRKAKDVAGRYAMVHSIDSLKLGQAMQNAWDKFCAETPRGLADGPIPPQDILVQVNIGREEQKSGVMPEAAGELLSGLAALKGLRVRGLMCLPPDVDEAEDARRYFVAMRELKDSLQKETGLVLPELSMGMSHDFEVAVEEGATIVRVGSDIFGPRV